MQFLAELLLRGGNSIPAHVETVSVVLKYGITHQLGSKVVFDGDCSVHMGSFCPDEKVSDGRSTPGLARQYVGITPTWEAPICEA